MTDFLAVLQPIQHSVSKTALRQWSRIIIAMSAMTGRVTMLGRMMVLLMLSSTGLAPISQAISGVLSKWSLDLVFAIPGALVLLLTIWMAFHPNLKGFSESLTAAQAEG